MPAGLGHRRTGTGTVISRPKSSSRRSGRRCPGTSGRPKRRRTPFKLHESFETTRSGSHKAILYDMHSVTSPSQVEICRHRMEMMGRSVRMSGFPATRHCAKKTAEPDAFVRHSRGQLGCIFWCAVYNSEMNDITLVQANSSTMAKGRRRNRSLRWSDASKVQDVHHNEVPLASGVGDGRLLGMRTKQKALSSAARLVSVGVGSAAA